MSYLCPKSKNFYVKKKKKKSDTKGNNVLTQHWQESRYYTINTVFNLVKTKYFWVAGAHLF